MQALITSDWHLSSNPRDEYRFHFVEQDLPILLDEGNVDFLLFLGDVTEAKDQHDAGLVNRVVRAFAQLSEICPVICLQGNHDWLVSPDSPYFGFLSRVQGRGISWIGVPTPLAAVEGVPTAFLEAKKTLLLPHSPDFERDWGELDFSPFDTIFAHQCFAGARSDSGFELGGVPLSIFPKKTQIISGDIHRAQELGQLAYVGAPYAIDFGDSTDCRVLIWDGEIFESVPCSGPQKQLLELKSVKDLKRVQGVRKGDILKVRVAIDSYDQWPETQKAVQAWAAEKGYALHQVQPVMKAPTAAAPKEERLQLTDEQVLQAFAEKQQLPKPYVSTGLKLL